VRSTYDWLIVGAGYSGAVLAERIATQLDQRVLVIDRRQHLAGNAYDEPDDAGVLVHRYGPHIFHTNSQRVWDYLSRFTDWRPYAHRVRALVDGKYVPVPFNLTTLRALFDSEKALRLEYELRQRYGLGAEIPVLKMREECGGELGELAQYIYDKIFLGYTLKQWDLRPEELAPSVTGRIPIRISDDDRYFLDRYQAMPTEGYGRMFQRMLSHPNIHLALGLDYRDLPRSIAYKRMIYTGPIDGFFDYQHGQLPYRSLRFEFESFQQPIVQSVASVNYPNDHAYTRITEFKHITGQQCPWTTIAREYSQAYAVGVNEPFYPIPRQENREMFARYREEAANLAGAVVFCGRLADYQYYNMDQVVARALVVFEQEVAGVSSVRDRGDIQPKIAAA
jgi:UDP-galactopyranose mutase